MDLDQLLEECRQKTPGCEITAFGNLRTKLIFRSSHSASFRRETLDELCSHAVETFEQLDVVAQIAANGRFADTAGVFDHDRTIAFARTCSEEGEFLCIVSRASGNLRQLLHTARQTLHIARATK